MPYTCAKKITMYILEILDCELEYKWLSLPLFPFWASIFQIKIRKSDSMLKSEKFCKTQEELAAVRTVAYQFIDDPYHQGWKGVFVFINHWRDWTELLKFYTGQTQRYVTASSGQTFSVQFTESDNKFQAGCTATSGLSPSRQPYNRAWETSQDKWQCFHSHNQHIRQFIKCFTLDYSCACQSSCDRSGKWLPDAQVVKVTHKTTTTGPTAPCQFHPSFGEESIIVVSLVPVWVAHDALTLQVAHSDGRRVRLGARWNGHNPGRTQGIVLHSAQYQHG